MILETTSQNSLRVGKLNKQHSRPVDRMQKELLNELDQRYLTNQLEQMIRIGSVIGEESELAEYIQSQLTNLGLKTELHEVEPHRPNVYGRIRGSQDGPRLMFNGHTDTVPVSEGWDTDPFTPVTRNGKIFGLGACDMKAGVACTLAAVKALVDSGTDLRGELFFTGVIDEEGYSKGAKALLTTEYAKCDSIILCEPYPGDESKPIPLGITGKMLYDVTVKGHAAHGFWPEEGINAIDQAAKILSSLNNLSMTQHPQFGKGNYCTLKIEGGYQRYSVVVPDRCRFEVNRLLVPGETIAGAIEDMRHLISSLGLKAEVDVNAKPPQYEPFTLKGDEPILRIFNEVYKQIMGKEPMYEHARGITDANVFAGEAHIPCLHLGPKRGNTHQPNEYVPIDWLQPMSQMYLLIAARYLA